MRAMCSCGRAECELGMDLCAYCHADWEQSQQEQEHDDERDYPGDPGEDIPF